MKFKNFISKFHDHQFVKFIVVGFFNTLFGYLVFAGALFVGLHYALAAAVSVAAGAIFNFQTIGHFVFGSRHYSRLFKFFTVYFLVYLLKVAGLSALQGIGVNNYLGGALLILPLGIFSFSLNKFWVFMNQIDTRKKLALELKKIDPNEPLGLELFEAVARLSVTVSFEGVLFRENDGQLEIFLTRRSASDTAYPGDWHCPGTVFRPHTPNVPYNPESDAATRLAVKEFGVHKFASYKFVGEIFINEERGVFNPRVYLVRIEDPIVTIPGESGWFSVGKLPRDMVAPHRDLIIPIALKNRNIA